jgi:predicted metal-dependent phosphoesterase TrpH
MIRVDTHSHTKGSDGRSSAAEIVAGAQKAALDVLCLTDHHTSESQEAYAVEAALREAGVVGIRGCEYTTLQGHLLIYGLEVPLFRFGQYPDMQAVIDEVTSLGGVCITPHPYAGYTRVLGEKLKTLTGLVAIESLNGKAEVQFQSDNRRAREAAKRMGLPRVGGSDAHSAEMLGLAVTIFEGETLIRDAHDLVEAFKGGKYRAARNDDIFEAARARRMYAGFGTSWEAGAEANDETAMEKAQQAWHARAPSPRSRVR